MTETLTRPTDLPEHAPAVAAGDAEHDIDDAHAVIAETERYLTFSLGGEVFALPILDITEILEFRHLTVVPMMPPFIRGVINLRGRVVPVVDLAGRFNRGSTEIAQRTSIIIVEAVGQGDESDGATGQDIGVMVDAVNKVIHLAEDDIEPPPAFGAGIRADFISGMAKYDGEFIIVLDVSRVLNLDEMVQLGKAALAQAAFGQQSSSGSVSADHALAAEQPADHASAQTAESSHPE